MELHEWILANRDRWDAICGMNGRSLSEQEAMEITGEFMAMRPMPPEYIGVIYVIMHRYGRG